MPHLNELQDKYGDKGLSVLGLTKEGKGDTEKWITTKGAKYAYAYDKGGKLGTTLGVQGIPHSFLIDATGNIVWEGHPGELKEDDIEKALVGAMSKPVWDWPKELNAVKTPLQKRQFAAAISEASKLSGDQAGLKDTIQKLVDSRVAGMKSAKEEGDFLTATESATDVKKECAGLDAEKEATTLLDEIAKDATAGNVIKAQQKIRKLRDDPLNTPKDVEAMLKQVKKVAQANSGNGAGKDAEAFAAELEAKLKKN